jgi:ribosomal protein L18E
MKALQWAALESPVAVGALAFSKGAVEWLFET